MQLVRCNTKIILSLYFRITSAGHVGITASLRRISILSCERPLSQELLYHIKEHVQVLKSLYDPKMLTLMVRSFELKDHPFSAVDH
jgi:hypothetical protein